MSGPALRILVTGANAGVGREIARDLYSRGHHVVIAVRNVDKGDQAKADIGTWSFRLRPETSKSNQIVNLPRYHVFHFIL